MTSFSWPAPTAANYPVTDVWLGIGDSEGSGRGAIADAPVGYEPASNLQMFKTLASGVATLNEPCGDGSADTGGVGPYGLFGWRASLDTGRNTLIINSAVGSTTTVDWAVGGIRYRNASALVQVALSRRNTTFRGFMVFMGLNDAAVTSPTVWRTNMTNIIAGLRSAIGSAATGKPVGVVQLPVTVPTDVSYPEHANVRSDITAYIADSANNLLIAHEEGPWVEGTKLHLNTAANNALSVKMLAAFKAHGSWA